jgi:UrcA family protein
MTMKLNEFRRSSVTLATFAACLIAGSSLAAGAEPAASVRVPYGDLNLTSEQGVGTFHARVAAAARQVCGADGLDIRNLQAYAAERSCEAQAIANAEQGVQGVKVAASLAARHERT